MSAQEVAAVERSRPGELDPRLWAMAPRTLHFGGGEWTADRLPAVWSAAPAAVALLGLEAQGLVVFGPYGDTSVWADLLAAAEDVAHETGQGSLLASVRNDELERFEYLQRLGFIVYEARLGVYAAGDDAIGPEPRFSGDIAVRDELLMMRGVLPR